MLGLFKKEITLFAPVEGSVIDLVDVKDEVFSKKMMGDGIAIQPSGNEFVAPCDGELFMVFKTGHAFGMKMGNLEVLVHIGIDTVTLQGEGFEILAEQGVKVKKGTPIIRINSDFLRKKGFDLTSPIIITSPENPKKLAKTELVKVDKDTEILKIVV